MTPTIAPAAPTYAVGFDGTLYGGLPDGSPITVEAAIAEFNGVAGVTLYEVGPLGELTVVLADFGSESARRYGLKLAPAAPAFEVAA